MRYKKIVFFIFLFAFILRIIFILSTGPHSVCSWSDDGYYNDTANAIYGILSHLNIFIREFINGRLGKGEGVLNTYGLSLPFGIFHRGLIHPIFIALIYLISGLNNFKAVWITQGLLDSFSCILLYFIGKRIFSKRVALIASFLSAIYLPFIHFTTKLMQETLITFLLLLTILLLIKAIQDKSWMSFLGGGFSLFLITTGRLAFMYLFFIIFICIIYFLIKEKNIVLFRKAFFGLVIGFLVPLLMWMGLVAAEFAKFGKILVGPGAGIILYRSNIVSLQGWYTDEDRLSLGPHLTQRIKKMGFSWDDKNTKWPPDNILLRATWKEIVSDPKGFLLFIINRIRLLWIRNLAGFDTIQFIHNLAVLLVIIGIPLALFKAPFSILSSSIIIYLTVINTLVGVLYRYHLPAMPFVFLISCFTIDYFIKSFFTQNKKIKKKIILFCLLAITLYLLSLILSVPFILLIFNQMRPASAFIINILIKNIYIFSISTSIYFLLFNTLTKPKNIVVTLFSFFCFVIFLNSWSINDKSWRHWSATLTNSNQRIKQEILIPRTFLGEPKEAYLKIDMEQSKLPIGRLLILVNDELVKEYKNELSVENENFFYFEYEYVIKNPARMRRWFSIPIDVPKLKNKDSVTVVILYEQNKNNLGGWIKIFGDYPYKKQNIFIGPLFARSPFETSIQKYLEDNDYRINGRVKLESTKTISSFYDGRNWSALDLSEKLGIQNGQFRIRLEIIDKNGNILIY